MSAIWCLFSENVNWDCICKCWQISLLY